MQTYQPAPTPTQPAHKSNPAIWIVLGSGVLVLLLIAVVAIVLVGRNLITNTNKIQNAVPANQASTENENSRPAATPESSPSPERLNIVGHWVGTNDGTPATLVIDESDTDSYNGTEYVAESTPVKLAVEIKIDQVTRHITIDETQILKGAGSWNLGFNQGTISADGQQMSGTAKDVKEKIYSWSFTKQVPNSNRPK